MRRLERHLEGLRPAMSEPVVYVVIVNRNLKDDTAECLSSVLASEYPHCQVLMVDNGSTDGSPDHLQRTFPSIQTIINPTNLGFARAVNMGIERALASKTDYVFLLNNDTVVDASMLSVLVETAESDRPIGLVGPKILYYAQRETIWHLGGRAYHWLPVPLTLGHNRRDHASLSEPFEVDYFAFCGILIKRVVLETIGLLDERFFFSYEDSDFCSRARAAGYRIICQPKARMWHKVSVSARKDSVNVQYLKSKGRGMFYRLHPHGPHPWLTTAYVWASTLLNATANLLRGDSSLARAALRGLYDGYRERLENP